jgi:hypothetical protein
MSVKPQQEVKPFTTAGTLAWQVILGLRKRIEKGGAA